MKTTMNSPPGEAGVRLLLPDLPLRISLIIQILLTQVPSFNFSKALFNILSS
jgi:hypothetical protein